MSVFPHAPLTEQEACVTGLADSHLAAIDGQRIHRQAVDDFLAMQRAAANAGVNLQIASGFRDYHRQAAIWQRKVTQLATPTDAALHGILRWSAMPGASRHHWGTDMDVYDPSALGTAKLQLEPWEYANDGPFAELTAWLDKHAERFNFYRPYAHDHGGVAVEPWHLSYAPVAEQYLNRLTPQLLCRAWQQHPPAAAEWLLTHCDVLVARYVRAVSAP